MGSFLFFFFDRKNIEIDRFKQFGDFPVAPSDSTRRDASNGGIIISNGHNFGHLRTKHRFRFLEFLIKKRIFIGKTTFSWDTDQMEIRFGSVASKRFGWTGYRPTSAAPSHQNII